MGRKAGDKNADKGSRDRTDGTSQLDRKIGTGQLGQDSYGRKDMTGRLEKTGKLGQDNQDRMTVTGQPG
jgi:hypothetical protein